MILTPPYSSTTASRTSIRIIGDMLSPWISNKWRGRLVQMAPLTEALVTLWGWTRTMAKLTTPVVSSRTRFSTTLSLPRFWSHLATAVIRTRHILWPTRELHGRPIKSCTSRRNIPPTKYPRHQIGMKGTLKGTLKTIHPRICKRTRSSKFGWGLQVCLLSANWPGETTPKLCIRGLTELTSRTVRNQPPSRLPFNFPIFWNWMLRVIRFPRHQIRRNQVHRDFHTNSHGWKESIYGNCLYRRRRYMHYPWACVHCCPPNQAEVCRKSIGYLHPFRYWTYISGNLVITHISLGTTRSRARPLRRGGIIGMVRTLSNR